MKNKIVDLRDHLFATLEALRDPDKPMELDRAKAIADVGKVIVDSAKVEAEFVKVLGRNSGTGFVPEGEVVTVGTPAKPRLVRGKDTRG